MFESFTDQAKAIIGDTQHQASVLGHNYVGTEHLLFSLLAAESPDGPLTRRGVGLSDAVEEAARRGGWLSDADALRAVGLDPAGVAAAAKTKLGSDLSIHGLNTPTTAQAVTVDQLPLTPRAKTVLNLASAAAGDNPATPRHILIGILEEDGGLAVIVLDRLGVNLDELRAELRTSA